MRRQQEMNNKKQAISAGGLIYRVKKDNVQILLVRPFNKETFEIPKGHMKQGETLRDAAYREIFEETGIKTNLFRQLSPVMTQNEHEIKAVVAYIGKPIDDDQFIGGDAENAEIKWFSINDMPTLTPYQEKLIWEGIYVILNDYIRK